MAGSGACSLFVRIFWPVLLSLVLPAIAAQLLALDPANGLLAGLADVLTGIASTRPGCSEHGNKLSGLDALFW
jgi:hypothetical protein